MIIDKNSPIPQYFQLQAWLMEQIEEDRFKIGDRIPTEKEFVQMTGLARATIRQAIRNLVNLGYLASKRGSGTYVQDRDTDSDKRTIIGILIPDIRKGYAPELARGAEDEATKHRHSLILCNTDDSHIKAGHQADRLIEAGASGVVFVPTATSDTNNRLMVEKFARENIPVVLADRTIAGLDVDHVTTDNYHGAYSLIKYLISKGHRRIAVLLGDLFSTERERLAGYMTALDEYGIQLDPAIVKSDGGPFVNDSYRDLVVSVLQKRDRYSAIFAGHDRIALLFYSVAKEMGIDIPGDISLVGYDDLPFTTISLTTMHQPIYELGQASLKLILSRIRGDKGKPQKIVMKSYLVKRSSVKVLD